MAAREVLLYLEPNYAAQIEAMASAREISIETLILEALEQYVQSKQWAAFDKDIQALMRENAELMRRLADS